MNTNASNHTQYFGFPLFAGTDKPSVLTDWNGTMEELDTTLEDYRVRSAGCEQTNTSFMDQVNILKDRFTQVEARISGDEDLINDNAREIIYLKEAMIVADTSIKRLMSQLTDILTKNDQQDQAISQINSTLATLTGRVDSLQLSLTQGLNAVGQRIDTILSDDIVPTETLLGRILATFTDAWAIGEHYSVGDYVYYQGYSTVGKVYRCLQANTATSENSPENSEYWEDDTRNFLYESLKYDRVSKNALRAYYTLNTLAYTFPTKGRQTAVSFSSDEQGASLTDLQNGTVLTISPELVQQHSGYGEGCGFHFTSCEAEYPGNVVSSVEQFYTSPDFTITSSANKIVRNEFIVKNSIYDGDADRTLVKFIVIGCEIFAQSSLSVTDDHDLGFALTIPSILTNINLNPVKVTLIGKRFDGKMINMHRFDESFHN